MSRPVKWSRDLHPIRERAIHARTETWSRIDIERLFGVGRVTAQTLMRAIGEIQPVGGAHFVERTTLLNFLDAMIEAPDVDEAFRARSREAEAPPADKAATRFFTRRFTERDFLRPPFEHTAVIRQVGDRGRVRFSYAGKSCPPCPGHAERHGTNSCHFRSSPDTVPD